MSTVRKFSPESNSVSDSEEPLPHCQDTLPDTVNELSVKLPENSQNDPQIAEDDLQEAFVDLSIKTDSQKSFSADAAEQKPCILSGESDKVSKPDFDSVRTEKKRPVSEPPKLIHFLEVVESPKEDDDNSPPQLLPEVIVTRTKLNKEKQEESNFKVNISRNFQKLRKKHFVKSLWSCSSSDHSDQLFPVASHSRGSGVSKKSSSGRSKQSSLQERPASRASQDSFDYSSISEDGKGPQRETASGSSLNNIHSYKSTEREGSLPSALLLPNIKTEIDDWVNDNNYDVDDDEDDDLFITPQQISTGREERDAIDGVEFLSFESEHDMMEYTKLENASRDSLLNDAVMSPSDDWLDMMDDRCTFSESDISASAQAIVPTKTKDITKIKGWRTKHFAINDNPSEEQSCSSVGPLEDDDGFGSCDIRVGADVDDPTDLWETEVPSLFSHENLLPLENVELDKTTEEGLLRGSLETSENQNSEVKDVIVHDRLDTVSNLNRCSLAAEEEKSGAEEERLATEEEPLETRKEKTATEKETYGREREILAITEEKLEREKLAVAEEKLATERETLETEREKLATEKVTLETKKEKLATEEEKLSSDSSVNNSPKNSRYPKRQSSMKSSSENISKSPEVEDDKTKSNQRGRRRTTFKERQLRLQILNQYKRRKKRSGPQHSSQQKKVRSAVYNLRKATKKEYTEKDISDSPEEERPLTRCLRSRKIVGDILSNSKLTSSDADGEENTETEKSSSELSQGDETDILNKNETFTSSRCTIKSEAIDHPPEPDPSGDNYITDFGDMTESESLDALKKAEDAQIAKEEEEEDHGPTFEYGLIITTGVRKPLVALAREQLSMLREKTNRIDENWARFAASVVTSSNWKKLPLQTYTIMLPVRSHRLPFTSFSSSKPVNRPQQSLPLPSLRLNPLAVQKSVKKHPPKLLPKILPKSIQKFIVTSVQGQNMKVKPAEMPHQQPPSIVLPATAQRFAPRVGPAVRVRCPRPLSQKVVRTMPSILRPRTVITEEPVKIAPGKSVLKPALLLKEETYNTSSCGIEASFIPEESIDPAIKKVVSDMLDYVARQEPEDLVIHDPPSEIGKVVEPPVIPEPCTVKKRKGYIFRELSRLDVNVIDVWEGKNKNCSEEHCRLGCLCESLVCSKALEPEHCGKEECMFSCKCDSGSLKKGINKQPSLLSPLTLLNLSQQNRRVLAKEEKEFQQTVIRAKDKTIVVGSSGRRKREIKLPGRFRDSYVSFGKEYISGSMDLKSSTGENSVSPPRRRGPHSRESAMPVSPPKMTFLNPKIIQETKTEDLKQQFGIRDCSVALKKDPVPAPSKTVQVKQEPLSEEEMENIANKPKSRNVATKSTTPGWRHTHNVRRHAARTVPYQRKKKVQSKASFDNVSYVTATIPLSVLQSNAPLTLQGNIIISTPSNSSSQPLESAPFQSVSPREPVSSEAAGSLKITNVVSLSAEQFEALSKKEGNTPGSLSNVEPTEPHSVAVPVSVPTAIPIAVPLKPNVVPSKVTVQALSESSVKGKNNSSNLSAKKIASLLNRKIQELKGDGEFVTTEDNKESIHLMHWGSLKNLFVNKAIQMWYSLTCNRLILTSNVVCPDPTFVNLHCVPKEEIEVLPDMVRGLLSKSNDQDFKDSSNTAPHALLHFDGKNVELVGIIHKSNSNPTDGNHTSATSETKRSSKTVQDQIKFSPLKYRQKINAPAESMKAKIPGGSNSSSVELKGTSDLPQSSKAEMYVKAAKALFSSNKTPEELKETEDAEVSKSTLSSSVHVKDLLQSSSALTVTKKSTVLTTLKKNQTDSKKATASAALKESQTDLEKASVSATLSKHPSDPKGHETGPAAHLSETHSEESHCCSKLMTKMRKCKQALPSSKQVFTHKNECLPIPLPYSNCHYYVLNVETKFDVLIVEISAQVYNVRYKNIIESVKTALNFGKTVRLQFQELRKKEGESEESSEKVSISVYAVPYITSFVFIGPCNHDDVLVCKTRNGQFVNVLEHRQPDSFSKPCPLGDSPPVPLPFDKVHDILKRLTATKGQCNFPWLFAKNLKNQSVSSGSNKNVGEGCSGDRKQQSSGSEKGKESAENVECEIEKSTKSSVSVETGCKTKLKSDVCRRTSVNENDACIAVDDSEDYEKPEETEKSDLEKAVEELEGMIKESTYEVTVGEGVISSTAEGSVTWGKIFSSDGVKRKRKRGAYLLEEPPSKAVRVQPASSTQASESASLPGLSGVLKKRLPLPIMPTPFYPGRLVSSLPFVGYVRVKYTDARVVYFENPANHDKLVFRNGYAAKNWISRFFRSCVVYMPPKLPLTWEFIPDGDEDPVRQPLDASLFNGKHVVTSKGLFDIDNMDANNSDIYGLKPIEVLKLQDLKAHRDLEYGFFCLRMALEDNGSKDLPSKHSILRKGAEKIDELQRRSREFEKEKKKLRFRKHSLQLQLFDLMRGLPAADKKEIVEKLKSQYNENGKNNREVPQEDKDDWKYSVARYQTKGRTIFGVSETNSDLDDYISSYSEGEVEDDCNLEDSSVEKDQIPIQSNDNSVSISVVKDTPRTSKVTEKADANGIIVTCVQGKRNLEKTQVVANPGLLLPSKNLKPESLAKGVVSKPSAVLGSTTRRKLSEPHDGLVGPEPKAKKTGKVTITSVPAFQKINEACIINAGNNSKYKTIKIDAKEALSLCSAPPVSSGSNPISKNTSQGSAISAANTLFVNVISPVCSSKLVPVCIADPVTVNAGNLSTKCCPSSTTAYVGSAPVKLVYKQGQKLFFKGPQGPLPVIVKSHPAASSAPGQPVIIGSSVTKSSDAKPPSPGVSVVLKASEQLSSLSLPLPKLVPIGDLKPHPDSKQAFNSTRASLTPPPFTRIPNTNTSIS